MIDEKFQEELKMKYNPDGSSLRKAQLRMLEILLFVDKVCKAHNIEYWIEGGTLLGAVRHGGFIPWDDDTDIVMSISEYRRFRKVMLEHPNEQFAFQDHSTDDKFFNYWGVVRDLHSEYIQNSVAHQIRKYRGLQVDIFPMADNVCLRMAKLSYYHTIIRNKMIEKWANKISISTAHFLFHLEGYTTIPVLKFFSLFKRIKENMSLCYGITFFYKVRKEFIYPLSVVNFEGYCFPAPHNPDAYLRQVYGDYITLPPENKRGGHEVKVILK